MKENALSGRKLEEIEFHNKLRDPRLQEDLEQYKLLTANRKYYSVARASMRYYMDWLREKCPGKRVLDYGCGDGTYSRYLARNGAQVVGIDISDVSVENCRRKAHEEGLSSLAVFEVMDCENLQFDDSCFDLVCEAGVLHHLDLPLALSEIRRVLRPEGRAICYEALGHNPLIQAYRRITPHLRTRFETEHILRFRDLELARDHFATVAVKTFHLAVLAAVPFYNTPIFLRLLAILERIDGMILSLPMIRSQAWMMIFELSSPRKTMTGAPEF